MDCWVLNLGQFVQGECPTHILPLWCQSCLKCWFLFFSFIHPIFLIFTNISALLSFHLHISSLSLIHSLFSATKLENCSFKNTSIPCCPPTLTVIERNWACMQLDLSWHAEIFFLFVVKETSDSQGNTLWLYSNFYFHSDWAQIMDYTQWKSRLTEGLGVLGRERGGGFLLHFEEER